MNIDIRKIGGSLFEVTVEAGDTVTTLSVDANDLLDYAEILSAVSSEMVLAYKNSKG